jgi:hypothetical protein
MIYILIGIPITLILLTDLGSVFTRFLKFIYAFLYVLYSDGYFDRFLRAFKRRKFPSPFWILSIFSFKSNKSKHNSKQANDKKKSTPNNSDVDTDTEDVFNEKENDELANKRSLSPKNERSSFQTLVVIALNCLEQTDDAFDLSFTVLFGLVFIYLSLGAIVSSRMFDWPLFDGYYYSLIVLTKISAGSSAVQDTKYMILSFFYALIGLAFFTLTIQNLQEKIRQLLIRSGQNIIDEIIKFANQLGYRWSFDYNLNDFAKANNVMFAAPLTSSSLNKKGNSKSGLLSSASDQEEELFSAAASFSSKHKGHNYSSFGSAKYRSHSMNPQALRRRANKKLSVLKDRGELKLLAGGYKYRDVEKCDKQTQITTLLSSKFKFDFSKRNSFSDSTQSLPTMFESPPSAIGSLPTLLTTVASIKPNNTRQIASRPEEVDPIIDDPYKSDLLEKEKENIENATTNEETQAKLKTIVENKDTPETTFTLKVPRKIEADMKSDKIISDTNSFSVRRSRFNSETPSSAASAAAARVAQLSATANASASLSAKTPSASSSSAGANSSLSKFRSNRFS